MPENQATNEEKRQAAEIRKMQSHARGLQKAGNVQANIGRGLRNVGSKMQDFGAQKIGEKIGDTGRGIEKGGRTASLRARALQKQSEEKNKGGKGESNSGISGSLKTGSGMLLKSAWTFLIPSWGLTLVWINIHVFLSWIFPSTFCKLGREWTPNKGKKISGGIDASLGLGESLLLVGLDILFFALVIFFAILLNTILNPVESTWSFFTG